MNAIAALSRPMSKARNINRIRWLPGLLALAMLAAVIAACAPAAPGPGDVPGPGGGVDAGDIAPPFAMQLADGSQVTLKNLVDNQQPAFLMYFATW